MWLLVLALFAIIRPVFSCGGDLEGLSGIFTHPSYPQNYQPNQNCRWNTEAREKDQINFKFLKLDLEKGERGRCFDYVSILYDDKPSPEQFCGLEETMEPETFYVSNGTGNPLIRFQSDDSMQFSGFQVQYTIHRYPYCDDKPCQNDGACEETEDEEQGFRCDCVGGWGGDLCEDDLDECLDRPCKNEGECTTPEFDMFHCECKDGYSGEICDVDVDECESNPCENGGTCEDEINGYDCDCAPGYEGSNCEIDINECASNPCKHGSTCYPGNNRFVCRCAPGYAGSDCGIDTDECQSEPCQSGGTCEDKANAYECVCAVGYEGRDCEIETDECDSNPCENNARCEDKLDSYECHCTDGFRGTYCEIDIDECASAPCQNGGHCFEPKGGEFYCACVPGFIGSSCEFEVDECASNPCFNGRCEDLAGRYYCVCPRGFTGTECQHDVDECVNNNCKNKGKCQNTFGSFKCLCRSGYSGWFCEFDINECESNPCQNGGSCRDETNKYSCACVSGYGGTDCEIELDECDSDPCLNDGHCIDQPSQYECICQDGYAGVNCELDGSSPCASVPCLNDGTCEEDEEGGYKCLCADNYSGDTCQESYDNSTVWDEDQENCHPYRCLHAGTCIESEDKTTCQCREGFTGKYCETDIDNCESHPCVNGGSCVDRVNEFWCICREGYSGIQCEDDSGVQWQSDTQMLAALLPSLLFLLLIGLLAATFFIYVRRKKRKLSPMHSLVEVKPAETKFTPKRASRKLKKKVRFGKARSKSKPDRETVIDYDYNSPTKFTPYIEQPLPTHYNNQNSFQNSMYDPHDNMFMAKGMFYPTGNMPQHKNFPPQQLNYSQQDNKAFSSPYYQRNYPNDLEYSNRDDEGRYRKKPRRFSKAADIDFDSSLDTKNDIEVSNCDTFEEDVSPRRSKPHWQDRDADKLKSVPSGHIYVPPEDRHSVYEKDDENRKSLFEKPVLARNSKRQSIRFREPHTRNENHIGEQAPSLQREKTNILPRKSSLKFGDDSEYPKTVRSSFKKTNNGRNSRLHLNYNNPF